MSITKTELELIANYIDTAIRSGFANAPPSLFAKAISASVTRGEPLSLEKEVADAILTLCDAVSELRDENHSLRDRLKRLEESPRANFTGAWKASTKYAHGDLVQFNGSMWHCNADAPDHAPAAGPGWTMVVRRGRDGKDADGRRAHSQNNNEA